MIDTLFSFGSAASLASWLILIVLPRWRGLAQRVAGLAVPAFLSLAYLVLIATNWSGAAGGFGSPAEVRALFDTPAILVAGWFHYLAFDLLIGALILRQAEATGTPHLLLVPILLLTFLFGPIGYLAWLTLRAVREIGSLTPRPGLVGAPLRAWRHLAARESTLAATGLIFVLATIPTSLAYVVDERTLGGVNVWLKPLKFEVSLGLFAFTLAWFMPMASEAFRRSLAGRFVIWGFALPAAFEIAYIAWRASRGEASHFNVATADAALGYTLMGIGAVTLTATAPVLAWGIARRDAPASQPAYRLAVILGLVLTFLLGGVEGMVMSSQLGHAVGSAAAGDTGVPIVGWLRTAGDLRVAHFLGIHAQQVLPMVGALLVFLDARRASAVVWGTAALYSLATLAAFVQAMAGRPALPM